MSALEAMPQAGELMSPQDLPGLDLSILIVSHGHSALVRDCLASLDPALTGLSHEIIVTDNLAEPGFVDQIGGLRDGLSIVVNDKRCGFGANMNQAAARAKGRVLLVLNPDTFYHSGQVAEALALLESDSGYGIVAARLLNPDLTDQRNFRGFPSLAVVAARGFGADDWKHPPGFYRRAMLRDLQLKGPTAVDWVYGSFMLIRKTTFEAFGGFDEGYFMYYEDVDLCLRLRRAGLATVVDPGLCFVHHHQRTSAQDRHGSHRKHHMRSALRYLKKSHGYFLPPAVLPLPKPDAGAGIEGGARRRRPVASQIGFVAVLYLATLLAGAIAAAGSGGIDLRAGLLAVLILLVQFMMQEFDAVRIGDTPRRVVGILESSLIAAFPFVLIVHLSGQGPSAGRTFGFLLLAASLNALATYLYTRLVPSAGARIGVVQAEKGPGLAAGLPFLPLGLSSVCEVFTLCAGQPGQTVDTIASAIRQDRIDHILLLLDQHEDADSFALLRGLSMFDIPVWHSTRRADGRLILLRAPLRSRARDAMKRGLDLLFGLSALALLSPPMLAVMLAIKLEDGGPVFFSQIRCGRNQVPFRMLKFRSMRADQGDARADRLTTKGDVRITRIGAFIRRTSLDELPQLLNVVAGQMSMVGPRPLPVGFHYKGHTFEAFVPDWHYRHRVRPGITGLSQLRGLRGTPDSHEDARRMMSDRVTFDNLYIDNWTFWLDLRIIIMTVVSGAFLSGAY